MHRLRIPLHVAARWLAISLIGLLITSGSRSPRAADPQPYDVTLKPTGDSALDAALHDSASLISLRDSAPVGGFALTERARQDQRRFEAALRSFGYYKAKIAFTIDGHDLDDPNLPVILDQAPAKPAVPVVASFDLGPRFQFGHVTISTWVPPDVPAHLGIESGQPAMAAPVLAAQGRLLDALRNESYPLAKVPMPIATLRPDENKLDVDFQPDAGPKTDIGPITLSGLKDMNESFVRRRLTLHQGEPYSPAAIEAARVDLSSIGVFSVVRAEPANALDPDGQLPITFDLTERPLHAVDLNLAYSTDLGVNFTTVWHDRNLFGNAEQLNLTAGALLGGNAVTKPGYKAGAQFIKPDFLARDQSLEVDLNAVKQSLPGLRPDSAAGEDRAQPQVVAALDRQLRFICGAGVDPAGRRDATLQSSRHSSQPAIRQHDKPAGSGQWHSRYLVGHADRVAWNAKLNVRHHAACRFDLPGSAV